MTCITTQALLDGAADRTGLARDQLLLMAAKSAAVRHVARGEDGANFVLKGGTLLSHVFSSPRQSIADADYCHTQKETVKAQDLEKALTMDREVDGMGLDPIFHFEGRSFEGASEFSFADIDVKKGRLVGRTLKITISVRKSEPLEPKKLSYNDPLLASDSTFDVWGLERNELAAEKMLGWCSKQLAKHFVDLAYLAREHRRNINHEAVAGMIREKFSTEKKERRYGNLKIARASDLPAAFFSDRAIKAFHENWDKSVGGQLLFLPSELEQAADQTLTSSKNVEQLVRDFWQPTLEAL